jgi:hypothetical protein
MSTAGTVGLVAVFLIAAAPIPTSHQPPPQQQSAQAADHHQGTQAKQNAHASAAQPIPITISGTLHVTADGEAKDRSTPQKDAEKSLFDFTLTDLLLAIFTAALVGVGIFQWNAMMRQEGQLRRSIVEARRASNRQSREVQAQIGLARRDFVSTHRPKIILREAFIGSTLEGEPISVTMNFANIGQTAGTIIRSVVDVEVIPPDGERLLLHISVEPHHEIGDLQLGPGAARLINWAAIHKRANSSDPPIWNAARFQRRRLVQGGAIGPLETIIQRESDIHLFGQFIYVDEVGIPRRTAFRRILVPEKQRFYRLEGEPDLDYAD